LGVLWLLPDLSIVYHDLVAGDQKRVAGPAGLNTTAGGSCGEAATWLLLLLLLQPLQDGICFGMCQSHHQLLGLLQPDGLFVCKDSQRHQSSQCSLVSVESVEWGFLDEHDQQLCRCHMPECYQLIILMTASKRLGTPKLLTANDCEKPALLHPSHQYRTRKKLTPPDRPTYVCLDHLILKRVLAA
jgi:hypothetical protein